MRHLLILVVIVIAGMGAGGCRRKVEAPKEPPPVCALRLADHLKHTEPDALPAEAWFRLLFKGYSQGMSLREPVDCLGDPIRWDPLPETCKEREPEAPQLPAKALTKDDLIIRNASGKYWFGWVPFRRFENGMGEGPIAIARLHKGRLEFRAVGTLRGYFTRPRLEVRKIGSSHVLVAEGEACSEGSGKDECKRALRLMWLDRQRFRMRPLRSATVRACLGPAWFPTTEIISSVMERRWERTLRRDLAVAFQEDAIAIDEAIAVSDRDREQPSLPPRMFREAQGHLSVKVIEGEFATEGQSIWPTIQIEDAATERDDPPSPKRASP